jgi:hypothetical protein
MVILSICYVSANKTDTSSFTFEQMLEYLLKKRMDEAGCMISHTELYKRVQDWSSKVCLIDSLSHSI